MLPLYTESMHYFYTVFFFIFGSLLGSFCNVVVLRMAISRSVIFPPSACPKCNHQLHAIDLFPIFSWLFLRGKCRYCKAPISVQYPLGESFMAIIICLSFFKTGPGLEFVCLASTVAIWFVITEIFIRNEVLRHQPFIWAIVYTLGLKYLLVGTSAFTANMGLIFSMSLLYAVISGFKSGTVNFTRWFCMSFLVFYNLPVCCLPYSCALTALPVLLDLSKPKFAWAKWYSLIVMLVAIIYKLCIYPNVATITALMV